MTDQPKVHTWEVQFDPSIGYKVNTDATAFPKVSTHAIIPAVSKDKAMPDAKQWWCVISEEGLGTIYGPYLTQAAAQSLIDEGKAAGTIHAMQLQ